MCAHIAKMAEYNEWMNSRLYEAAATLLDDERMADKGAFFGSLYGTLSHILLADTIWLKRFAGHAPYPSLDPVRALPAPSGFDQRSGSFAELRERRAAMDRVILAWAGEIDALDLPRMLEYRSMAGLPFTREYGGAVMHFFNHQTHHRGQATTLLSQAGIDMGPTDLIVLVHGAAAA